MMGTKMRSSKRGGRRGRQPQGWPEAEDELVISERRPTAAVLAAGNDELRQLAARRRLEQYLESKRLREHLQEIFYEDER